MDSYIFKVFSSEFHACVQCNMMVSIPSPPFKLPLCLLQHVSSQFHFFNNPSHPIRGAWGVEPPSGSWEIYQYPILRKEQLSSHSTNSLRNWCSPEIISIIYVRFVSHLSFYRFCVGKHSCCEIMTSIDMSYSESSITQNDSPSSDSYLPHVFPQYSLGLGGEGFHTDISPLFSLIWPVTQLSMEC